MKILLVNPIVGEKKYIKFPLGLAYIASVLLKEGYNVSVLDINAYRFSKEEVEEKLRKLDFDLVGTTGLLTEYNYLKWLCSKIKEIKPNSKIMLGGGLATLAPELMINKCNVDFVVIGEGEAIVVDLVNAMEKKGDLRNVQGIAFKNQNGKIVINSPAKIIEDLDSIPFPAWDIFPIKEYLSPSYLRLFNKKMKTMVMIASRGCPYNCTYCFKTLFGFKYRNRSAYNIIQEIKLLKEKYGVNGIQFNDDTFVLNKKMVIELCDKMIEEKLNITWLTNGRVNLMDKELLKKMREAGCRAISYGIESGSQKIIDDMKKGITVQQINKAIKETWDEGILPHGYLMIGMPNDTKYTINETIKLCKELSLIGQFSIVTPIPGSELWEEAKRMGKIKHDLEYYLENWSKWGDKIMFNLTNMTDKELLKLKRQAELKIFFGKMPLKLSRHLKILKTTNIIREGLIRLRDIIKMN